MAITDETLHNIMEETDAQARHKKHAHPDKHKQPWITPTLEEFKGLPGLCFLIGIVRKPRTVLY